METRFSEQELELSHKIIGLAMKVHTKLGPGLLEQSYKECLFYELKKAGFRVEKEKPMPLIYDEIKLDCGYRIDLVVDNKIVIEIKTVEQFHDVHLAQTLTYMKLGEYRLVLMFNFKVARLKEGLRRVVLADRAVA
jgi:GxxExxY protein